MKITFHFLYISLCWLNFFVQSLFFQALWKIQIFSSQFFSIHRSQPRFGVGWPKTTIKRLGTTIYGSQPEILSWEPQIVVPNHLIVVLGQPTPNLGWDLWIEKNWDKKICVFQSVWKKRDCTKKFSQHGLGSNPPPLPPNNLIWEGDGGGRGRVLYINPARAQIKTFCNISNNYRIP